MRKFLIPAVLAGALAVPSPAMAANEYTITASFSPTNAGTKAKPRIVSGKFGFQVQSTTPGRPAALDRLTAAFNGIRMNTAWFRRCTATQIERASSDKNCPSASLVATGFARNLAGNVNDRSDASLQCYLTVKLYNSGRGKAALFVRGTPNAPEGRSCVIEVGTAIPVSITRRASGDRLQFTIPNNLKEPLPGAVRNALVETQLTLKRRTVRRGGKTRGFFESVGGCRNNRRTITVTFDNEGTADDRSQSGSARCRR